MPSHKSMTVVEDPPLTVSTAEAHPGSPHHNSKGRKGDQRYHKAVAARLANPELTHFEALVAGGFHYDDPNDALAVDDEQVTLGQRKNQLSRRIRLAKKQLEKEDEEGARQASDGSSGGGGSAEKSGKRAAGKNKSAAKPLNVSSSAQAKRGLKRGISSVSAGTIESIEEDVEATGNQDSPSSPSNKRQELVARNHPDFKPLFVPSVPHHSPPAAALLSALPTMAPPAPAADARYAMLSQQQQQLPIVSATMAAAVQQQQQQQQQQDQQQHHASSVAVASLINSAQAAGLTLEQLAVALNQLEQQQALCRALAVTPQQKQELALQLFHNSSKAMYAQAMLLAGFTPEQAQPGSVQFRAFAATACQYEYQRLLQEEQTAMDASNRSAATNISGQQQQVSSQQVAAAPSHGHDHQHQQQVSALAAAPASNNPVVNCYHDRHIHRLEGKCGHKAIVHQPEGGMAHIDFVVGDKVECYQEVRPVAPPKPVQVNNNDNNNTNFGNPIGVWPSQYKCKELNCDTTGSCNADQRPQHSHSDGSCVPATTPRLLDLDEIDFDGSTEWNSEYDQSTLLGLFKLGDMSAANSATTTGNSTPTKQQDAVI